MNDQLFSPTRTSYIQSMRRRFLRTLRANELSIKVLTGWRSGDLFVGAKRAAEAIEDDPDIIFRGGRRWGGGNGFSEGLVRFDAIEIEAYRRKSKGKPKKSAFENEATNDEGRQSVIAVEKTRNEMFLLQTGQISYPFCCFTARGKGGLCLWICHILLVVALFGVAVFFSFKNPIWAGLPAYHYMVFIGIFFVSPIVSWMMVLASIRFFRKLLSTIQNPSRPEKAETTLNILYLIEKMSVELVALLTFLWDTISFLLLFSDHPTDMSSWVSAYKYISAILGTITVYCLGAVVAQYITHSVTKEVNVSALGQKLRSVLRAEVALWRILEVIPEDEDFKLYQLMEDPFLTYDPKKAGDLARALVRTPMCGNYTLRRPGRKTRIVEVRVESPQDAALLGSWAYGALLRASHKHGLSMLQHNASPMSPTLHRSPSYDTTLSGSGTHLDALITDYYSVEQRRVTQFKRLHKLAVERNQDKLRNAHGLSLAYKVFPYLDLAIPTDFMKQGVEAAAADEPWSKIGIIRGVPKQVVTKAELDAALKHHASDIVGLPGVEANTIWPFFDPENVGRTGLKRTKLAVMGLVEDRKNLKTTLENTAEVVKKLRSVVSSGINFFVFLCALAIFGLDVLEVWVGISSIVLAFSFVFGGSLKSVFDSVVFLFGVHPYDVGDKLKIGTTEDVYFVKRISLMSTQMTRWDGASVRFMNQYLFNVSPLINVRRSANHERTLSFLLDAASLPSRLELEKIQFEFEQFLSRSPGSYSGSCSVTARDIIHPLQVRVTIWWAFSYPDLDAGRTFRDTSKVIQFLIHAMRKRNIKVSGVNSGQTDLEKGGSKKLVGLQAFVSMASKNRQVKSH